MTANKLKIAVTGGIGSGKSTVSGILKELGYKVYDADRIYSDVISDEKFALKASEILGIKPIHTNDKKVFDRKAAAAVIFNDETRKNEFDRYIYPVIYGKIDDIYARGNESVFFEIPLLFETKRADSFDKVIIVKRNLRSRIESVKLRSNLTEKEIRERINNQIDYENFDFGNHIVIHNDGNLLSLRAAVEDCVAQIFQNNS